MSTYLFGGQAVCPERLSAAESVSLQARRALHADSLVLGIQIRGGDGGPLPRLPLGVRDHRGHKVPEERALDETTRLPRGDQHPRKSSVSGVLPFAVVLAAKKDLARPPHGLLGVSLPLLVARLVKSVEVLLAESNRLRGRLLA